MNVPAAALSGWTRIRTEDEEAFLPDKNARYEGLIGPLKAQLMRSAWRIVRHPDLAEDALQETLLIVWKKLERVERHPNPQALILKIGLDAAYDALRRQERRRRREEPFPARELPSPAATTGEAVFERKEIEEEVLAAIARLPRKQAAAVLMRVVQEQPYPAIAQALGCRETTARIHVSQGRARLSRELLHLSPKSVVEDIR